MLTKILVTTLVILGVLLFFRIRSTGPAGHAHRVAAKPARGARFGRMLAYGFAALLVLICAVWYLLHWQAQHRIVTIRVIGDSGMVVYKAYTKDLDGSRIETLDGRTVILGDSERVEIVDSK